MNIIKFSGLTFDIKFRSRRYGDKGFLVTPNLITLLKGIYQKDHNRNLFLCFDESSAMKGLVLAEIITRCKIEYIFFIWQPSIPVNLRIGNIFKAIVIGVPFITVLSTTIQTTGLELKLNVERKVRI